MTTTNIMPNGTPFSIGWTPVAAATVHQAWNDSNDATFCEMTGGQASATEDLGTFTIPAGSYIKDLLITLRAAVTAAGNIHYMFPNFTSTGFSGTITLQRFGSPRTTVANTTPFNFLIYGYGACFDGGVMTQAQLDSLQVLPYMQDANPSAPGVGRIYQVTVGVVTSVLQTVTGSTIAFSGIGLQPKITWTTTNPDLGHTYYRAKIFTAAQVAVGTFNPDTDAALWDSGDVLSGVVSPSAQVTTNLTPGTGYVVALKLGDQTGWTFSGNGATPPSYVTTGLWTLSNTLTLNTVAPARPYMTLTDQPNNVTGGPRVQIDVVTQDNLLAFMHYSLFGGLNGTSWFAFDANTTIAEAAAGSPFYGTNVIQMTRNTSTGDAFMTTHYAGATASGTPSTFLLPVVAGRTYAVLAQVKSAATSRSARVEVDWFNSSGTFLSTSTLGSISTSTSAWKMAGTSVVAPASSAFARMGIRVLAAIATEVHYVILPVFRPLDNGDTITGDGVIHPAGAGYRTTGNQLAAKDADMENVTNSFQSDNSYGTNGGGQASTVATGRNGTRVGRATSVAAGAAIGRFSNGADAGSNVTPYPIADGVSTLWMSAWAKPPAVNGLLIFVGIQFFNSLGYIPLTGLGPTFISAVTGTAVASSTASFTQCTCTAPVPEGAVGYLPLHGFIATGGGQTMDWDTLQVSCVVNAPYSVGGINENILGAGVNPNNDQFQRLLYIERSADGGSTWTPVRTAYGVLPTGTSEPQTLQVFDYEIIAGTQYTYRVSEIGYYNAQAIPSSYYTPSPITPALTTSGTNPQRWWLKDPITPANSMQVDIMQDTLRYSEMEAQASYEPLGRTRKIVVSDVVYGRDFDLTFDFISPTEYAAFKTLRNTQRTLLLQRQWNGDSWFVRIGQDLHVDEQNSTPIRYLVQATAMEVDVPPV